MRSQRDALHKRGRHGSAMLRHMANLARGQPKFEKQAGHEGGSKQGSKNSRSHAAILGFCRKPFISARIKA
jgi:hypothetical protein